MKQLLAAIFCFGYLISSSQFKADNVKYKTVFPEDLCKTLKDNPGFVLLDVRSDGEYNDTVSGSPALNIGHLQNALHINITQLPQRWKELVAYKDKPLFIYCSHSQRSRRASRLLADSGFTHIYNINGGLTNFYDQGIQSVPCDDYTVVSTVPYKIVSAKQLANSNGSYYIVDLREDSAFNGKTDDERIRMQGCFADAVNIPFTKLPSNDLSLPSKPVLLVDDGGGQSPIAAKMLLDKGFKDVTILFNGMDGWVSYLTNSTDKPTIKWKSYSSYKMLSPDEFNKWMKENKSFTLIDVRPKDQFNSEAKNYIQNIGHIKGAVNIPYADLNTTTIPSTGAVVVYGFNSEDAVFNTARFLKGKGYSNLYVLQGGIWNLRWASHNLKNKEYLNEWVLNVPLENQ
jgi:rhodanese-related sulfurtransferase